MIKYFNSLKRHHQVIFAIIIAFAVVSFWRGTWGLLDYALGADSLTGYLLSILIGVVILFATGYIVKMAEG